MLREYRLWLTAGAAVLIGLGATVASAQQAARGANAVQQRENRSDGDRWKRSETAADASSRGSDASATNEASKSEPDDDEEDDDKDESRRPGELNGKLDLGEWS